MQDLLKEEEFLKPKYNPWRLFLKFYGIAIVQVVLLQVVTSFWLTDLNGVVLFLIFLLLPLLMAVVMFTSDSNNFFIERKVKILALTGFALSYTIPNLVINMIKIVFVRPSFSSIDLYGLLWSCVVYFVIELLFSFGVIYMASALIKRRSKVIVKE